MSKNFPTSNRRDLFQHMKPTGSMIITSSKPLPLTPKGHKYPPQSFPHEKNNVGIYRHNSEEELSRHRERYNLATSEIHTRPEEYRNPITLQEKAVAWQSISKGINKDAFFRGRAHQKSPLSSQGLGLGTHKSEKTLPSFLAGSRKIGSTKGTEKKGLSKNNFRILRQMGEGKFGNVFLVMEIFTGMIVAMKAIPKKKVLEENMLTQIIREMKIQTFLDHPNIIKNYGFFCDEEYFYTLMEVGCDGQLYDLMEGGSTLSEESTSFIIGNLLEAVENMHNRKILHRDIKPENIVLVHGNVKLCDFGWAVNKKEELRSTFCGTPLYLSPELLQGSRYDEKVDIWAIGVLAYELVLGCSPFNIKEQEDLLRIVTDDIVFPSHKKISPSFKDFIIQILRKNPKDRMNCSQLLGLEFIKKYQEIETCEELCQ